MNGLALIKLVVLLTTSRALYIALYGSELKNCSPDDFTTDNDCFDHLLNSEIQKDIDDIKVQMNDNIKNK